MAHSPDNDEREFREYASPPCLAHEFEQPQLDRAAILNFLNELIEGERAGTHGILDMVPSVTSPALRTLLREVAKDEARFCAMLTHHVERFGGNPSRITGVFAEKLARRESIVDKLTLLNKGQAVVVRMLAETIPGIDDPTLKQDLIDMQDVHEVNISKCAEVLADLG